MFCNLRKTDGEKNEEIHNRDSHQFPDLYNQIPGELQVQKQPLVVFFK